MTDLLSVATSEEKIGVQLRIETFLRPQDMCNKEPSSKESLKLGEFNALLNGANYLEMVKGDEKKLFSRNLARMSFLGESTENILKPDPGEDVVEELCILSEDYYTDAMGILRTPRM